MRVAIFIFLIGFCLNLLSQPIDLNVIDPLLGEEFSGTLTYLDYSTDKNVTIRVDLNVTKVNEGSYKFAYTYPTEPKANSISKLKINGYGTKIGGNTITKVEEMPDGELKIWAESKGKDNNEVAYFYITYLIGKNKFSTVKEVRHKGSDNRFIRNEYLLTR